MERATKRYASAMLITPRPLKPLHPKPQSFTLHSHTLNRQHQIHHGRASSAFDLPDPIKLRQYVINPNAKTGSATVYVGVRPRFLPYGIEDLLELTLCTCIATQRHLVGNHKFTLIRHFECVTSLWTMAAAWERKNSLRSS